MSSVEQDALEHKCPYRNICNFYSNDCVPEKYMWYKCWAFITFKGVLRDDIEIRTYTSKTIKNIIEENNEN